SQEEVKQAERTNLSACLAFTLLLMSDLECKNRMFFIKITVHSLTFHSKYFFLCFSARHDKTSRACVLFLRSFYGQRSQCYSHSCRTTTLPSNQWEPNILA